jgi:hypothetical protein
MGMNHEPTAVQKRFWSRVAARGCEIAICRQPAQVAHMAGKPSVTERLQEPKAKGLKLRRLHWLVLPLCPFHHHWIDNRPISFEREFGRVADMLDRMAGELGVDVWAKAKEGKK